MATWTFVMVEGVIFYPDSFSGAWYELGSIGEVGTLYMPMNADGTPDIANLSEVEVAREDA